MSLTPRNIILDGPDVMSKAQVGIAPLFGGGEASPIYSTLDASASVNGTYTEGTFDYEFIGAASISQRTRVEARSIIAGVFDFPGLGVNYEVERDHDISSWINVGFITSIDALEFVATLGYDHGSNGGPAPFAAPIIHLGTEMIGTVTGTRTDTSTSPPTVVNRSIEINAIPPFFQGGIATGTVELVVVLKGTVNVGEFDQYSFNFTHTIDASAWGTPNFRDIRGTYGETSTDVRGIEYIWSITLA